MNPQIKEVKMNLRETLCDDDDCLTKKGVTVQEILFEFEDPLSSDAIHAAAKEIDVDPEDLQEFFEEEENKEWLLNNHREKIENLAEELKNVRVNCEWMVKKALALNNDKEMAEQQKKQEFNKKIDDFAERLKTCFRISDKQLKIDLNIILGLRKSLQK